MSQPPDTAIVHEAPNLTDANLVVALLSEGGIPAFIDNESATVMLDGYIGSQRIVKVRVPGSALGRARELIAEARSARFPDEEE